MPLDRLHANDMLRRIVLCAVDQRPFESGPSRFCVLTPLVTENGERIEEPRERLFPNRGRIWWMLRREIADEILVPGALFTAQLEEANDYNTDRSDKDFLQARRDQTAFGSTAYLEVIRLNVDPDPNSPLGLSSLTRNRPPTPKVLLAGPRLVSGPWTASWDGSTTRVHLSPAVSIQPVVWYAPLQKIGGTFLDFTITANVWDRRYAEETIRITVAPTSCIETLTRIGVAADAADDQQVMKWGLKHLGYSRAEQQGIKSIVERCSGLSESEADVPPGRLQRFRRLCESAERVVGLGAEIATLLAGQEAFRQLVEDNLEAILAKRLADEIGRRSEEIERETLELEDNRQRLQRDIAALETEYAEKDRQLATQLHQNQARREQELEDRERALELHTEHLGEQEQRLRQRAAQLQDQLDQRNEEIYQRLVDDLPILMRITNRSESVPGRQSDGAEVKDVQASNVASGGPSEPRQRGGLSEHEFLDQFERVARHRGFIFDRDDLANVHIAVKAGLWTVLAGRSGTGKSSLPRLYAEALGVLDELLFVSVRPDWLDDRDVLGGFNALSERYEPAATGLVDRLIAAREDDRTGRGGLYLICLDEMNLSRVEHYFAQLLSTMERPPRSRAIDLFSKSLERPGDPYAAHRRLPIGDNIRFLGTVNIDETSYFFSPRVIDRTSLIILDDPDLASARVPEDKGNRLGGLAAVHRDEYDAWIRPHDQARGTTVERLLELDRLLREGRSGLAHRTLRRFLGYAASADTLLGEDRAFDFACAQIIIPRLRVSTIGFAAMIEALRATLPENRFPRSARLLARLLETDGEYDFFQLL